MNNNLNDKKIHSPAAQGTGAPPVDGHALPAGHIVQETLVVIMLYVPSGQGTGACETLPQVCPATEIGIVLSCICMYYMVF